MSKQFHIVVENKDEKRIDLNDNEAVSIQISNNPYAVKANKPVTSMYINGNRFLKDEMYLLKWNEIELFSGDKITIDFAESDIEPSPIFEEELYVKPEEDCSFCFKKKSEVSTLIASKLHSHICNECVDACVDLIEKKNKGYLKL
jgi:ClpX C4-type zinc finger protein